MTIDKAKEELESYMSNKRYQYEMLQEYNELRARAENTTSILNGMPHGSSQVNDKMAEYICTMIDKYDAYLEAVKKQEEENERIRQKIEMMSALNRDILTRRYIRGRNMTEVAGEIYKEYYYTCALHGKALKEYAEIE